MVTFVGSETYVDLIILVKVYFDVILGHDWLASYHVIFDYYTKVMNLTVPGVSRLVWKGTINSGLKGVISILYACHLKERWRLFYVDHIHDTSVSSPPPMNFY